MMNVKQVFAYLEENLLPEKGGKIQFIKDELKEIVKIYIFDARFYNYKYIFSFIREELEGKSTFQCYVKSGFSGIDHKLEIPLTDEFFYGIQEGLRAVDMRFMRQLEADVNACIIPEIETSETLEDVPLQGPSENE